MGSYESVDVVVAPSDFMRASVSPGRFPSDRVRVIHNGVDTNAIRSSSDDRSYALFVGRLSPEKGVETLLRAHADVSSEIKLKIAGTGPLERAIRGRFPKIELLGHLTGPALEAEFGGASVVVVPSDWYENCPMSILEAMAYGKPVIGSDLGGIPELIVHGKTGFLFPAGDYAQLGSRLLELMGHPEMRRQFGIAARLRAEAQFSLERHNNALLELYQHTLGRERPRL
jgi:glycosyltransferase involved in cell wall biosynthesis